MTSFTPKDWKNDPPDQTTPLSAAAIEELETRLSDYTDTRIADLVFFVGDYGALGDGSNDDTGPINDALTAGEGKIVYCAPTADYYKITDELVVPDETILMGAWGGGWTTNGTTRIVKTNGDTNANRIVTLGQNSVVRGLCFAGPDDVDYRASTYPGGTNNPSYGIYGTAADSEGSRVERCRFRNFKTAGIGIGWYVAVVDDCYFWVNLRGIDWTEGGDSRITNSVFIHNVHSGVRGQGNYIRYLNNRFEWNKRYGLQVGQGDPTFDDGADAQITANTFDRNGWSGLALWGWQAAVTGNLFRRNGGGGNGTVGLTAATTTIATDTHGNVMYLAPATERDASHINMDYAQEGVVTGNAFGYGGDDAGAGSISPKYVYSFRTCSNQTVKNNNDADGYNPSYAGGGAAMRYVDVNNVFIPSVASASVPTLPEWGDQVLITGTDNINSLTASWASRVVTLWFEGILTVADANTLQLNGNFTTSAGATLTLFCDGTNWYEIGRVLVA